MFKIINENVEELEALSAKPSVEKVKHSEIKAETEQASADKEYKTFGEALLGYLDLTAEEKKAVLVGLFDDSDENK